MASLSDIKALLDEMTNNLIEKWRQDSEDEKQALIYQKALGWPWKDCLGKARYDRECRERKEELEDVQPIVVEVEVNSEILNEAVEVVEVELPESEEVVEFFDNKLLFGVEVDEEKIIDESSLELTEIDEDVEFIDGTSLKESENFLTFDPFSVHLCENGDNGVMVALENELEISTYPLVLEEKLLGFSSSLIVFGWTMFYVEDVRVHWCDPEMKVLDDVDDWVAMHVFDPGGWFGKFADDHFLFSDLRTNPFREGGNDRKIKREEFPLTRTNPIPTDHAIRSRAEPFKIKLAWQCKAWRVRMHLL